MLLRMSKKARPYILKRERSDFYKEEIKKLEDEILKMKNDVKIKEHKEIIEELKKADVKQKEHLEKYGPAVFNIVNASKERLAKKEFHQRAMIGSITDNNTTELTTGLTGINKFMAIQAFKEGFESLSNAWDFDKPEKERKPEVIGKKDVDFLIDVLPLSDIQEVATEILGGISEEEKENLT